MSAPQTSPDKQRHQRGGLFYEDFHVGELIRHRLTRTVT